MGTISYPSPRRQTRSGAFSLEQLLLAVLIGFLIFGAAVLTVFLGTRLFYAGRIFPGVSVAGVDVSGMSPADAESLLVSSVQYSQKGRILLVDGDHKWLATPGELGLMLDARSSAQAAFQTGRNGPLNQRVSEQVSAAANGLSIRPILVFDQRIAYRYLTHLATEIDKPALDATLSLKGTDVMVTQGQVGRSVDVEHTLVLLSIQMQSLQDGIVRIFVNETPPVILDATVEAEQARKILSAPLTLNMPGSEANQPGPWVIQPQDLAGMLKIQRSDTEQGPRYNVGLGNEQMISYLASIAPKILRYPQSTRFTFNDDSHLLEVIEPATIGRSLDVQASLNAIQDQLRQGEHQIALSVTSSNPPVTDDMSGEKLGITELVSSYTSYFRGSSAERVQNIKAAASKFHGRLVAPGETFSMASAIGDITLDNGFAEALIIVGGQTIKGVGGGVCQVSTTLFRTAFFGGFPIVERHAHAYRVGYYEQSATSHNAKLAGLDATVYVPLVDFKFTNDTSYWLLMETYVNQYSLTWKFYSTSDGRKVEWDSSGPTNIVEAPDPVYRENPDLAKDQIKQVDWAAEGADVTVTRTVTRNGSIYFSDSVVTHYQAWQDVFEYGPGTEIPPKPTPPPG